MNIACIVLLSLGVVFLFLGAVGILRYPDCYTRMHAAGKCDTLGSLLIIGGLAFYHGVSLDSAKILFIAVFIFLTSPTSTHAIARAAMRNELPLWTKSQRR